MKRRSFIGAILGAAAAPAIVRAASIMPIWVPKQGLDLNEANLLAVLERMTQEQVTRPKYIVHVGSVFGLAPVKPEGELIAYDQFDGVDADGDIIPRRPAVFVDTTFGAGAPRNAPLVAAGMISMLMPGQKLPPGWEYCDERGRVLVDVDGAKNRATFERMMRDYRAGTTHTA